PMILRRSPRGSRRRWIFDSKGFPPRGLPDEARASRWRRSGGGERASGDLAAAGAAGLRHVVLVIDLRAIRAEPRVPLERDRLVARGAVPSRDLHLSDRQHLAIALPRSRQLLCQAPRHVDDLRDPP